MIQQLQQSPLVIASHNKGKVAEIAAMLSSLHIQVLSAGDVNINEPEETGQSFAENAEIKACNAQRLSGYAALSDDSGLVIPAIGGAPGIFSARWAPDNQWEAAFGRIQIELLKATGSIMGHPAHFICALCLCLPDGTTHHFEGRVDGSLTFPPRGHNGFGYDPIFIPDGYDVTFGEMNPQEKNTISHRARAFNALVEFLRTPS